MKKAFNLLFVLALITGVCVQNAQAISIKYVTTTGAGSKDGGGWDNAYEGLQAALDATSSGQIWVASGTYRPTTQVGGSGTRYATFQMEDGVAIYGGFAGTETEISQRISYGAGETNETILSGDLDSDGRDNDDSYHVFYHQSPLSLTSTAILDGFTITGGNANGGGELNSGGGMFNSYSSPTITNCTFSANWAYIGGGISIQNTCTSTFTNCSFTSNTGAYDGGGIYNSSSPTFINCTFKSNWGRTGGGIENSGGSPSFTNCVFSSNEAGYEGYGGGAGIANSYSSPTYTNCTIASNTSTFKGGGIYNVGSSSYTTTLKNCIVWGNSASITGHEFYIDEGGSIITLNYSCYGNESGDVYVASGGTFTATEHNITTNPQFVGSSNNPNHPYSIGGISPCADAGNDDYNQEQTYDVRGSGYPRKLNKTTGESGTIDMGAYEYKVGTDASLPVTLSSFTAKVVSGGVVLKWTTESETENLGFILEKRKQDTGDWKQVADYTTCDALAGHGSTSEAHEYTYTDAAVVPGATYLYRLADVDYGGKVTWHKEVEVKVESESEKIVEGFRLGEVFPNPFNATFTIPLTLSKSSPVNLTLCDLNGKVVKIIENGVKPAGEYRIAVDCSDLGSGIYFLQSTILNNIEIRKLVLIK